MSNTVNSSRGRPSVVAKMRASGKKSAVLPTPNTPYKNKATASARASGLRAYMKRLGINGEVVLRGSQVKITLA